MVLVLILRPVVLVLDLVLEKGLVYIAACECGMEVCSVVHVCFVCLPVCPVWALTFESLD